MRLPESRPVRRLLMVALAVLVLILVILGYFGWNSWQQHRRAVAPIPATLLDIAPIRLARPEAMIVSQRLRDLPHDLLSVPLLKAVLSEDFVFYYEENDALLGLKGALRRIAYEHKLTLGDEVIALALEQPADVALWHDAGGKLSHWLINVQRSDWTRLAELAARVAASDTQLSQAGTLALPDGSSVPVYKLAYAPGQVLLFAGSGDKMVIFSDPAMLSDDSYGSAAQRAKVWQALLDSHWQASPLRRHFGLDTFTGKHTVVAQTAYLSFNYQQFFPALEALRFDFDGQQWGSYARLNGGTPHDALDTRALWRHTPVAASLCVAMPVDAGQLAPVLRGDGGAALADAHLLDGLHAPVAACWYPEGGLYSPLVIAHVDARSTPDAALDALFRVAIGNSFATAAPVAAAVAPDAARGAPDQPRQPAIAAAPASAAPAQIRTQGAARIWQRAVDTDFGRFDVTMARQGDWLVFSPRARLVDDALAVFDKRRPALADALPDDRTRVEAVITPRTLASLLDRAALGSLPKSSEPILRAAAQNLLSPRLAALGQFAPVALMLPQSLSDASRAWQPIEWQTFSDAH